jgi:small subunit ribosomal protein S1
LLAELKEGEVRKGRVSSVRSFGVFIDLGGADGLAHLSEVSWDRNKSPEEMYKIGDEVDVYVMKVDPETKKIALSLRRAQPEQWDLIVDKYQVGRVVPVMVTKLVTFGAFARIEGPVEGLVHVSELVDRRIAHPKEVVREGDLLPLKIVRIERDRHRLGLSLREARDEGTKMGFVFSDGGEVIGVPEELRKEFEEREGLTVNEVVAPPPPPPSEARSDGDAAPTAAAAPAREPEPEPPTAMAQAFAAAGLDTAADDASEDAATGAAAETDTAAEEAPATDDAAEASKSAENEESASEASADDAQSS